MARAIVIGTGFGGLAAAVRLQAKGYETTVLEALPDAGGRGRVFHRDGFIFDAGPTVITAPYLFDELFSLAGKRKEDYFQLLPIDPFYRIEYSDGSRFDYVGEEDALLENIRKISPGDVEGYRKLSEHARRIFEIGYLQLADAPFESLAEMFRVVPDLVRLKNFKTVYGLVADYIKDERLRQAFTFQPLLVGGNPFDVTSIYLLIHTLEKKWGVHFAKGGTGAIVSGLTKLLGEMGAQIRYSTPVERLEIRNGRVTGVITAQGERIASDIVVSNADPMVVYNKMLDGKFRWKNSNLVLKTKRPSMGLFVIYFGTNKTYPDLTHHTIILGPRYRGLLNDIFHKKILAEDFSLYLHAPTRTDSTLAPPGHEGFYVLSPVPNNLSGIDWDKEGPAYCEKILNFLDQTHLPGLKKHLVTQFYVTPDYFEKDLRSYAGAGFGIEPIFRQSAWFRFHNRSEDVPGLYFVGASTHPGAGVPGVLCSAKVLDRVVANP